MRVCVIIICWICVMAGGMYLRFDRLGERSFHADEATGARITASRLESGDYRFDPLHYHGPLLSGLAMPLCRMVGREDWRTLDKVTLRWVPALAGVLVVLLPVLGRKRFGDPAMLMGAAILACSPLLVYFSRMFIHEMLLVAFGVMAMFVVLRFPRHGLPGVLLGLMFATKETFVISVLAWCGAGAVLACDALRRGGRGFWVGRWQGWARAVGWSVIGFLITAGALYSDGFRDARGVVDAVRTFFVYETVGGHEKAWDYYLTLLAVPMRSGGLWWFGTPVVVLALVAVVGSFQKGARHPAVIRFLALAAVGHGVVYSCIAYKTPWLACLPWAHVCLLAGFSADVLVKGEGKWRWLVALFTGIALVTQTQQSWRAIGRFASDERNPFAYVPTRQEIEALEPWLEKLRKAAPEVEFDPVAVVGRDYWPLPWYLRGFGKVGYWPEVPGGLAGRVLVFAMPETAEQVSEDLSRTHVGVPRGLRAGVPVQLFVRNDVWKRWMEEGK